MWCHKELFFEVCALRLDSHSSFRSGDFSIQRWEQSPDAGVFSTPARPGADSSSRRPPANTQTTAQTDQIQEFGAIMALRTLFSAEATYQNTTGNGDYGTITEL